MSYGNGNGGGVSPGAGGAGAGAGAGGGPESSPNILNLGNATADADLSFVETSYTFTDPPRYFKANDPYYFEVDNIQVARYLDDQAQMGQYRSKRYVRHRVLNRYQRATFLIDYTYQR